jgi:hypothetical protein
MTDGVVSTAGPQWYGITSDRPGVIARLEVHTVGHLLDDTKRGLCGAIGQPVALGARVSFRRCQRCQVLAARGLQGRGEVTPSA